MQRAAFTMIELIFVIVIIGILAAVAIPKLAATRDDAKVATVANMVTAAANEIAAYAVARGEVGNTLTAMSQVAKSMVDRKIATETNGELKVKMHTISDCLKLQVLKGSEDVNLTIAYGNVGSDAVCRSLQEIVDASKYPIPLGGKRTKW